MGMKNVDDRKCKSLKTLSSHSARGGLKSGTVFWGRGYFGFFDDRAPHWHFYSFILMTIIAIIIYDPKF